MNKLILVICMVGIFAGQSQANTDLISGKYLKCVFTEGYSGFWTDNKYEGSKINKGFSIQFDLIDLKARTARLVGRTGSEPVAILIRSKGLTFIEETLTGNFSFTTIYFELDDKNKKSFQTVHSRHMNVFANSSMSSQYYGLCTTAKP